MAKLYVFLVHVVTCDYRLSIENLSFTCFVLLLMVHSKLWWHFHMHVSLAYIRLCHSVSLIFRNGGSKSFVVNSRLVYFRTFAIWREGVWIPSNHVFWMAHAKIFEKNCFFVDICWFFVNDISSSHWIIFMLQIAETYPKFVKNSQWYYSNLWLFNVTIGWLWPRCIICFLSDFPLASINVGNLFDHHSNRFSVACKC